MSEKPPWFRCNPLKLSVTLSLMSPSDALVYTVLMLRVMEKSGPVTETVRSLHRRTGLSTKQVTAALISLGSEGHVVALGADRFDVPETHAELARQQTPAAQREYFGKLQRDLPAGWAAIKSMVVERDGLVCAYCGDLAGPFEIDHVVPYSRGGENDPSNLCVACKPCNRSKGAKTPEEWLS
ncbi:HNH endonuclease [Methylobacterium sp. E-005]|uniref:HNH endonuclease n=1 Tax=Methylobacterium sp. E-005 TaxID=2836549 RepID=UPI001FB8BFCC|nr:HNH endonuclease [Methylobacterium sp. E-005]MCJ2086518.1 HNH endonuclease [Methylobacterium sp. E-005]